MNAQELQEFLVKSLDHRKLTSGERRALVGGLQSHFSTAQERGVVRHLAFEIARRAVADPISTDVIEWLEEVLKVVAPIEHDRELEKISHAPALSLFSPGEAILHHLVDRFRTAGQTIDICVFTITDDRVSGAILEAHRRGVRVRVISDGEKSHDLGSDIDRFRESGLKVKLHRHNGPPSTHGSGHMHHKFAIFDSHYLVNGSYNWTRGAVSDNYENLIELTDPHLVNTFQREFDRLWNHF